MKVIPVLLTTALLCLSGQSSAQTSTIRIGDQTITGRGTISLDSLQMRSYGGRTTCRGPGCRQLQDVKPREAAALHIYGDELSLNPGDITFTEEEFLEMLRSGYQIPIIGPDIYVVVENGFRVREVISAVEYMHLRQRRQPKFPAIAGTPAVGEVHSIRLRDGQTMSEVASFYNCSLDSLIHLGRALHGESFDINQVQAGEWVPICVGLDDPSSITKLSFKK